MGISSLDTALSGLRISQQQIDVISNNVANVGTDGYTRKILPQSTQVVDGQSIGVLPGIITRSVDLRLERDLWTQISAVSNFDVRASYLGRIDQFHGDPAANVSVAGEVGKLQDTFAALSNAPMACRTTASASLRFPSAMSLWALLTYVRAVERTI